MKSFGRRIGWLLIMATFYLPSVSALLTGWCEEDLKYPERSLGVAWARPAVPPGRLAMPVRAVYEAGQTYSSVHPHRCAWTCFTALAGSTSGS